MTRTVRLVSEAFSHHFDYLDAFFAAVADPDVVEIRQIEGGRLRQVRRRDPTAPGGWVIRKVDGDEGDLESRSLGVLARVPRLLPDPGDQREQLLDDLREIIETQQDIIAALEASVAPSDPDDEPK